MQNLLIGASAEDILAQYKIRGSRPILPRLAGPSSTPMQSQTTIHIHSVDVVPTIGLEEEFDAKV